MINLFLWWITCSNGQTKYYDARMERDKEIYERQIKIVERQIDGLVYDLYWLTKEEIKVVKDE
jgi:hypothetical protein